MFQCHLSSMTLLFHLKGKFYIYVLGKNTFAPDLEPGYVSWVQLSLFEMAPASHLWIDISINFIK